MLPLECRYLNKNALTTLAGPLTPPVKHFQLKRKPKSATLRAELLQKCECCGLPWKHAVPRCLRASWRSLLGQNQSQPPVQPGVPQKSRVHFVQAKSKSISFHQRAKQSEGGLVHLD